MPLGPVTNRSPLSPTLMPSGTTSTTQTVTVTETAPLLDTGSSSLGTEVTNEFVSRMPLQGRDATQLVYLSAGVTQLNNADAYPSGTDFSSNGQRYGSAEI